MTNSEKRAKIIEMCRAHKKPGEIVKELGTSHATVKKIRDSLIESDTKDVIIEDDDDKIEDIVIVSRHKTQNSNSLNEVERVPMEELRKLIKQNKELNKSISELKDKYNVNDSYIRGILQL